MSPIRHLSSKPTPATIAFGTGELPELRRQSREYHQARTDADLPSRLLLLESHNHFSILEELAAPDGKLTAALSELVGTQGRD